MNCPQCGRALDLGGGVCEYCGEQARAWEAWQQQTIAWVCERTGWTAEQARQALAAANWDALAAVGSTARAAPPGPVAERTCLFCEGAGQRDCPFCDEGKRADPISGQAADCRHCDGAGSIVCRACRGTGKLGGQPPAPIR